MLAAAATTLAAAALGAASGGCLRRLGARPMPPALAAALGAGVALWAGATQTGALVPVTALLGLALLALTLVDAATLTLPDALTLPLIAAGLGLALAGLTGAPLAHLLAAAVGYGLLWGVGEIWLRLRGVDGLGLGDAKLLAAAGAWVGPAGLPWVLLLACGVGLVWALAEGARRGELSARTVVPLGPGLCAGFWLVWLYGA